MRTKPDFTFFDSATLTRFEANTLYRLLPSTSIDQSEEVYSQIKSICNEKEIFHWIFEDICPDGYPREMAVRFLRWANAGWEHQSHFVFIAVDQDQNIAGAYDIKSNDLELAEIGYWVSKSHSGIASNSIEKIVEISKQAGYKKLFAQTREGNHRSIKVLLRNGFGPNNDYLNKNGKCSNAFVLALKEDQEKSL